MQVQRFILFLILMIAYSWDLKVYQTILGNLASLTTAIPEVVYDSVDNHYVQDKKVVYSTIPYQAISFFHLQHYYKQVCQRVEENFICMLQLTTNLTKKRYS